MLGTFSRGNCPIRSRGGRDWQLETTCFSHLGSPSTAKPSGLQSRLWWLDLELSKCFQKKKIGTTIHQKKLLDWVLWPFSSQITVLQKTEVTIFIILNHTKVSWIVSCNLLLPTQGRSKSNCLLNLPVSKGFNSYQFNTYLCLSSYTESALSPHHALEFQIWTLGLRIWGFQLFPSTFQIRSW